MIYSSKNLLGFLLLLFVSVSYLHAESSKPNIIIIFTDDHGWADLSSQGVFEDVKTPYTDQLAEWGVRFTSGYVTAPQCRPSRAGLMSGRYQNRFGLEDNRHNAYPWSEYTVAERLRDAGYMTGMAGKWHLQGQVDSLGKLPDGSDATEEVIQAGIKYNLGVKDPGQVQHHGFIEHLSGTMNNYIATHSADGRDLGGIVQHEDRRYRLEVQAEWSSNFIKRHARGAKPFFLYTAFFAPHVPLEAPEKYLSRFSRSTGSGQASDMPLRRQKALAMISAVDDGVGLITKTLQDEGALQDTLIFYIGDNGAPLKIHKEDAPGDGPGWDGSLNDPWIGEKGMLTEGGIRVPFLASWPAGIPGGQVDDRPVISLDAIATALAAGGAEIDENIDGVDLLPYLAGGHFSNPQDYLYWRWAGQYAIRSGNWKYLKAGKRDYLFDLSTEEHESENLIEQFPNIANQLKNELIAWSEEQFEPGFGHPVGYAADRYFDHYLDGKLAPAPASVPQSHNRPSLFERRDINNDGFVTLEEYIGAPEGRNVPVLTQRFHALDQDHDGRLSENEIDN
ncbi:MAG: sulfatase-like hydrolase/transferase [Verrucomicrobia bacterium]|nr:sulfatase-like hydrolase/transferase [Verrucomicrobiota bacterium]